MQPRLFVVDNGFLAEPHPGDQRQNVDVGLPKPAEPVDRKAIEQAVALDPLTAALLTLDQIHEMVEEAFVALAEWLPVLK